VFNSSIMDHTNRRRYIFFLYLAAFLIIALVVILDRISEINASLLLCDPTARLGGEFYVGMVSNIGILIWCSTAAICLFSWGVVRRDKSEGEWGRFFVFAGILTAILALDDLFLFHDEIVPDFLFPKGSLIHINEKVVFALYGIIALWFLISSRDTIRKTNHRLLVLAITFFALSIVAERGFIKHIIPDSKIRRIMEDGMKLFGIVSWFAYFSLTAHDRLLAFRNKPSKAGPPPG